MEHVKIKWSRPIAIFLLGIITFFAFILFGPEAPKKVLQEKQVIVSAKAAKRTNISPTVTLYGELRAQNTSTITSVIAADGITKITSQFKRISSEI